jgi:peptidoglycan/xylan/chitin deacetylase (PgdA/CDA1 family)
MSTNSDNGAPKATVCLTVDFDAVSVWMQLGARGPKARSRGEFGAHVGAPRLLALLARYGIQTTWFIPGHTAETWPEVTAQVAAGGHEVAHHGYLHESFETLSLDESRRILRKGSASLERVTGQAPVGFRLPIGDARPEFFELLVDEGFLYDSSLCGDDFGLYNCRRPDELHDDAPNRFGEPLSLVEAPWSFIMNDFHHFEFNYGTPFLVGHDAPSAVEEQFTEEFNYMYDEMQGGIVTVIVHPQCIGRGSRLAMLERFIRHCIGRSGTRFATVGSVVNQYIEANRAGTGIP